MHFQSHVLQKSSLKVVCVKSFKAANPGQNNLRMHNAPVEKQTPVLLEVILYFIFYEDDLRLSPLTGLVITADWGCGG